MERLIAEFEKKTSIEIAVVTIDTAMTSQDAFDDYTLDLARKWGVGKKDKDKGVLVGISAGHRRMRIQNGDGIEGMLSDNETKKIVDSVFIPKFREGKFYEGTLQGLEAIMRVLEQRSAHNRQAAKAQRKVVQ
jgi:uncharacterized protein